jgi:pyruvate dehydrogenase E2 component (dihydrolipoamide acetyltransferase)
LTSLGVFRIRHFTPLVNPPQVGILGVRQADSSLPLSLSFDHGAVDGAEAAAFLSVIADGVERG